MWDWDNKLEKLNAGINARYQAWMSDARNNRESVVKNQDYRYFTINVSLLARYMRRRGKHTVVSILNAIQCAGMGRVSYRLVNADAKIEPYASKGRIMLYADENVFICEEMKADQTVIDPFKYGTDKIMILKTYGESGALQGVDVFEYVREGGK